MVHYTRGTSKYQVKVYKCFKWKMTSDGGLKTQSKARYNFKGRVKNQEFIRTVFLAPICIWFRSYWQFTLCLFQGNLGFYRVWFIKRKESKLYSFTQYVIISWPITDPKIQESKSSPNCCHEPKHRGKASSIFEIHYWLTLLEPASEISGWPSYGKPT